MSLKLLTIIGARPQFIKAAAFSNTVKNYPELKEVIVHTGQHYDKNMSKVFLKNFLFPNPNTYLTLGVNHMAR